MKFLILLATLFAWTATAQDKALLDLSLEPPVIDTNPGPNTTMRFVRET